MTTTEKMWNEQVDSKWKELHDEVVRSEGGVFIAKFNPRMTMNVDLDRRRTTRKKLMAWTVEFFKSEGVDVSCEPDDKNNDGFNIYG